MNRLLLLALLYAVSVPAAAIYKCQTGTKITYSDIECVNETETIIKTTDTFSQQGAGDSSQRLATDKAELHRLRNERKREEALDDRSHAKYIRAATSKRKQCELLEQRQQWAEEDAANASKKSITTAQRKARRAAETYILACGK
ncbi:MAG: hypothetical protein ACOH2B_05885 [Burkholderiaceae bacterium]